MRKYLVEIEEKSRIKSLHNSGWLDDLGLKATDGIIQTQKFVDATSPEEAADKIIDLLEYSSQSTVPKEIYVVVKDEQGKELLRRSSND